MKACVAPGSLAATARVLRRVQPHRVLLVTGRASYIDSGARDRLLPQLTGLHLCRFQDFRCNPQLADLRHGVALVHAYAPDMIVAVGGGSVLDMAKAMNALAAQPADLDAILADRRLIQTRGHPLLAIPTTAGSGSQATHFAAIYESHRKHSLAHEYLRPDYAIVDADLTERLPPRLTAITGFDALAQAVESFWAVGATSRSQAYAAAAIRRVLAALPIAVNQPDAAARAAMAEGAHLAGRAIDISRTTAAHAVSYSLTTRHGVPHGHAVALTLGAFARFNGHADRLNEPRGRAYLSRTMARLCALFGCRDADGVAQRLDALMGEVGLQTRLSALGVSRDDLGRIVAEVNTERLGNNPALVSARSLTELLEGVL